MQTIKNRYLLFLGASLIIVGMSILLAVSVRNVYGNVTATSPTQAGSFVDYTFFATSTNTAFFGSTATSTTQATSTNITGWFDSNGRYDNGSFVITGAKKVEVYFTRGATTTSNGTIVYSIQGTPDGSTWYDFPKLVLSTSTAKITQSNFVLTAATTTAPVSLDLTNDTFYAIRCIITFASTTQLGPRPIIDGNGGCRATAEF